jgi:hypothetical protein
MNARLPIDPLVAGRHLLRAALLVGFAPDPQMFPVAYATQKCA